jgi:predicted O-linked N-acetylglucosamine transferase (SPINDLY family)
MIITYHKSYEICDKLNEFRKKELVYSNILFNNLYNWNLSEEEIFKRSMTWSENFPKQLNMINISNKLDRNKINTKIKIGYISTDFITHPVGYMFESILKNHNINNFELFCYDNSNVNEDDDVIAKRLRSYNNAKWHKINLLSDEDTLKVLINDELDILIDMMGHTRNTRINIFQYKPAKVIISYFAYPGTTGVKEIDYKFTDMYANPSDTQKYSIEKFYYLPNGFQCYTPPIEINASKRYKRDKYKINLCCFNNPIKLSKPTIDIFIMILKQLPQSKLFLRYLYYKSSFYRSYMLKIFTDAGIEEDRVDIALLPIENCLDLYNEMDIALDPFPYNGGTISSEALYMNTPIITLAGTNYVSRIGVSLLSNLKLEKYIAYSYEEYIKKVIDLANNENELKMLHITLRKKMLECDLGNSISFTKNIENAYIDIMTKYHN